MGERILDAEVGTCDSCGKEGWVCDYMGDVLCDDCAFPPATSKAKEDE